MTWSEKVKDLMNKQGLNQKQLAEKSGITEPSVCRYLKGDRKPRLDVIVNFAKALNVDVEYLLDNETPVLTPYQSIERAIARNGNQLSEEEAKQLASMILVKKD